MECGAVPRLLPTNTAIISTTVLSSVTILLNSVALASIVKNYRKLRQRIYVFVISSSSANLLVGVAFLVDGCTKIFDVISPQNDETSSDGQETSGGKIFSFYLESFKVAIILLSCLNTGLLTYVLYKRTTSMGRHHEFRLGLGSDGGGSYLPAFDTMMRVLSLGSSSVGIPTTPIGGRNGNEKNNNGGNKSGRQNHGHENNVLMSDSIVNEAIEIKDESVANFLIQNGKTNSSEVKQKPNNSKCQRLFKSSVARRFSNRSILKRPRTSSSVTASQPYVGRHSNSVMTKTASVWTIVTIWIAFVITWLLPIITELYLSTKSCLKTCHPVYLQRKEDTYYLLQPPVVRDTIFRDNVTNELVFYDPTIESSSPVPIQSMKIIKEMDNNISGSPYYETIQVEKNISEICNWSKEYCNSCSTIHYPLSKLTLFIVACVAKIVLLGLIISSIRLYYLRIHSSNVFVRCSAIWRFVLITAIYYLITLAPFVGSCFFDFFHEISPHKLIITLSTVGNDIINIQENIENLNILFNMSIFHTISSCFVLLHCAFITYLFLVRLLGFRRILSSL